jgi:hypothetical protein
MMKRSGSFSGLKKTGETATCYGVSQGHYAIKTGAVVGTDCLGSCFALIACQGSKVFLAHVHAGATIDSLTTALKGAIAEPAKVTVVRGSDSSEQTALQIEALRKHYGDKLKEDKSPSGAVACDSFGNISKPANISPTNPNFKPNNSIGAKMGLDVPIVNMDKPEKV